MDKLIERLSSYHLFNNLLPGAVFAFFVDTIGDIHLAGKDIFLNFFVFYFLGVIIGRIGSIVVEAIAKKLRIIKYTDYADFIKANNKDNKIQILLEDSNMYRTFISLLLLMGLAEGYKILLKKFVHLRNFNVLIIIIVLIILFVFSFRKQTKYIYKRVQTQLADMQKGDIK
jgi:Na+(H+)/acetate symporter ActP